MVNRSAPRTRAAAALLAAWMTAAAAATVTPPPPGASVHPELWPAAAPHVAAAETVSLVEDLISRMSLEEKVGQMIQADIASITPEDLRTYPLGSILAGGNAAPGGNIRTTPQAWLNLTDAYHRAALEGTGPSHRAIPLLFGIDAVHGDAKLIGATIFPHNVGLGAAHDAELIRRIGAATAEEVASTGIDWTFAPTVAVARDVRWGRSYESYSESAALVAQYAAAMVTGLQGEVDSPQFMSPGHTLSSVKHFLGDGGTRDGRDQGDTVASEAELRDVHAPGYVAAIDAGAMIVMASYNSWNGMKLHGHYDLLTGILKGRMAFDGFVVGDWNAHEQVPGCTKTDCAAAILAGVDMLMTPDSWQDAYRNTLAEARAGRIPQARIDDAVRRILRVKARAGLFSRPPPPLDRAAPRFEQLGSAAHRAIAREAVRKSLVLLKNARHTLPLDPHAAVLVTGAGADDIGMQSGGWTIDWQGDHNANADFPGATSIYAGIRARVIAAGGTATLSRDGRFARKPDVAIVVFGEVPYAEFEGDRETLEFSAHDRQALKLLRRLHRQGVATVSVFLSGRPMWVNPQINASDAFVAAWLPGSEGEGIADVLFRAADGSTPYDFTGRLSFSWPRTAMPVGFDATGQVHGALFPRGAGLDYASRGELEPLSEDAQIPPAWRAPEGSLFHAGHVIAPWSVFVADAGSQVHVTTQRQDSPHGIVSIALGPDGAQAVWHGGERGVVLISGRAEDLRPAMRGGATLAVRYRIERAPEQRVELAMMCTEAGCGSGGAAALDVTESVTSTAPARWRTLRVPLSCWSAAGADLKDVEQPFVLATSGRFGMTIADVRIEPRGESGKVHCP
jgi:beta-glucosidase